MTLLGLTLNEYGHSIHPNAAIPVATKHKTILRLTLLRSQGECSVGWMLHAKIATDITTVTTLPVLSALNCGANRKSATAMTPAKHHSAASPVDIRPSGIEHTADLVSEQYSEHPTRKGYVIASPASKWIIPKRCGFFRDHGRIRATKARRTAPAASGPTEFISPYQGLAAFNSQGGSSSHSALGMRYPISSFTRPKMN